jgi:hypothetical protein
MISIILGQPPMQLVDAREQLAHALVTMNDGLHFQVADDRRMGGFGLLSDNFCLTCNIMVTAPMPPPAHHQGGGGNQQ